jgi:hypothetical protein
LFPDQSTFRDFIDKDAAIHQADNSQHDDGPLCLQDSIIHHGTKVFEQQGRLQEDFCEIVLGERDELHHPGD